MSRQSNARHEHIEIPPEAFAVKALWQARPSWSEIDNLVREIKGFVARTGKPYLWRGHTHTPPPMGATAEYWGEFDIPEWHILEAPCPCCWSNFPKYRRNGKIAFFPLEGVISSLALTAIVALTGKVTI